MTAPPRKLPACALSLQAGPPLAGFLHGQDALILQPVHVVLIEDPPERRVAEDRRRGDRHVARSASLNSRGTWRPILPWTAASVNVSRMI